MRLSDLSKRLAAEAPPAPTRPEAGPVLRGGSLPQSGPAPDAAPQPSGTDEGWRSAFEAYGAAIRAVKPVIADPSRASQFLPSLRQASRVLAGGLASADCELMALSRRCTAGNYLHAHAVNTAILSLRLAEGLGWSGPEALDVGMAALLHDAALSRHLFTGRPGEAVSTMRFAEEQFHPLGDQGHLENLGRLTAAFLNAFGAAGAGLGDRAQVVAGIIFLCATFETMTHVRDWRAPFDQHTALKMLIAAHNHAPCKKLLLALITRVSLYPVGTFLRLSDQELAVVADTSPDSPTRPVVEVWVRVNGTSQVPPRRLDMSKEPMLHVLGPADPDEVFAKDPELRRLHQLSGWWID